MDERAVPEGGRRPHENIPFEMFAKHAGRVYAISCLFGRFYCVVPLYSALFLVEVVLVCLVLLAVLFWRVWCCPVLSRVCVVLCGWRA